jgi:hypothetical protein
LQATRLPAAIAELLSLGRCTRVAEKMKRLFCYLVGVAFVLAGAFALRYLFLHLSRDNTYVYSAALLYALMVLFGLLVLYSTWQRYRGGVWSVLGIFFVALEAFGACVGAEQYLRGIRDIEYAGIAAAIVAIVLLVGASFLVLGHRRHLRQGSPR